MILRTSREAAVLLFCEENQAADAIQITAYEDGLVLDIGELRSDWGRDRTAGVLEWADRAPGDTLHLTALRKTGERRGCDEEWENVGEATVLPPSFEDDRGNAAPGLAESVLAVLAARARP